MDFFASDAFLTALARVYYGAEKFAFKTYEVRGRHVRLAEGSKGKILTTGPFYDYVKSFPAEGVSQGTVDYLPRLVTSTIALDKENPAASVPPASQDLAPLVRWEGFATWDEYLALLRKRSKNLLPARRKKLRRTTEEFGAPTFTFNNLDPEALDLCVKWKLEQYEGGYETLEDPGALAMLWGLFRDGHLVLSTLEVGGKYVAVHAGFLWKNEYLDLLSAYDPAFAEYGVGRELRLRLLEHSYRQGHESYDLLLGAEPYKWYYATHVQLVSSFGKPPWSRRMRDASERVLKQRLLSLSPHLFYRVKRLVLTGRRLFKDATRRFQGRTGTGREG